MDVLNICSWMKYCSVYLFPTVTVKHFLNCTLIFIIEDKGLPGEGRGGFGRGGRGRGTPTRGRGGKQKYVILRIDTFLHFHITYLMMRSGNSVNLCIDS